MAKESRVIFSHTKREEKEYLLNLLKEKDWFVANNFSVFLPKNETEVKKIIQKENNNFKKKIILLKKSWGEIEPDFFSITKKFKNITRQSNYYCHVSPYGPEGKYSCPNYIFIRLRTARDRDEVLETIGHELLHLMFKNYVDKNKLNYAQVENLVDDLMLSTDLRDLFPNYQKHSF